MTVAKESCVRNPIAVQDDAVPAFDQTRSEGMSQVVCIIRPERLDALLEAAFGVVEKHIGVVSITDCEVLRAERF